MARAEGGAEVASPNENRPSAEELRGVLKPIDSAWTVLVVDPVAQRLLAWVFRRRWVTPMGLTLTATVLGLIAAGCFAAQWQVAGAAFFEIRFLIDCLDGRLARLRGVSSSAGAAADRYGDRVVLLAVVAAASGAAGVLWLGAIAAVGYIGYFLLKDRRDERLRLAGVASTAERLSSQGFGSTLREHRIYPLVTSVDVEHAAFFVAPLVGASTGVALAVPALIVVAAYFVGNAVRFGVGVLRLSAADGPSPAVEDHR